MKRIINEINARFLLAVLLFAVPVSLLCQTTRDGAMPQYYFNDFTGGRVKMRNGQVQTPMLNYNTVTERMVFTRDNNYYDLTNPEIVDTIIIQGIRFVPVGKAFYEVLLSGPTALFIQNKGNIMPAGKQVGYGGTSQLASSVYITNIELSGGRYNLPLPSDFIVNPSPVYWIRRNDEMLNFVNEKQFLSLYPNETARIKAFIRENRIKIERKEHLIKLVSYCSTLK
jgi:hypothetical protein